MGSHRRGVFSGSWVPSPIPRRARAAEVLQNGDRVNVLGASDGVLPDEGFLIAHPQIPVRGAVL